MTREELNQSNVDNITGSGKVTKLRHGTHNTNIADYIDQEVSKVNDKAPAITYETDEDGNSVTDTELEGRTVYMAVLNDMPKNTGFDKPIGSDTFTFTDATTFTAGQTLTLLLK